MKILDTRYYILNKDTLTGIYIYIYIYIIPSSMKFTKNRNERCAFAFFQLNNKEVKNLYDKNFKSLKKEIKEDLRRLKDLSSSWVRRINIVKMVILTKGNCRFNPILIKIPTQFFNELERAIWPERFLPQAPAGASLAPGHRGGQGARVTVWNTEASRFWHRR
jgi:hypothetical protein